MIIDRVLESLGLTTKALWKSTAPLVSVPCISLRGPYVLVRHLAPHTHGTYEDGIDGWHVFLSRNGIQHRVRIKRSTPLWRLHGDHKHRTDPTSRHLPNIEFWVKALLSSITAPVNSRRCKQQPLVTQPHPCI